MEKENFIPVKSIFPSDKNCYVFKSNHQSNKMYKSVTAFSFNNAEFPTLTPLFSCKHISDCINVPSYKSVRNSFIKPVHKTSNASSVKTVPEFVYKCFIYNSSPDAREKSCHVSVNDTICKASITYFSECNANICRKTFEVVLASIYGNKVPFCSTCRCCKNYNHTYMSIH